MHHPHHFTPPPRPICLPNHHWICKPLPTGNQPPPPCCFYSSNSLSISLLSTDNSSGVCLPQTLSSLWPRPVLHCPPTSGEFVYPRLQQKSSLNFRWNPSLTECYLRSGTIVRTKIGFPGSYSALHLSGLFRWVCSFLQRHLDRLSLGIFF